MSKQVRQYTSEFQYPIFCSIITHAHTCSLLCSCIDHATYMHSFNWSLLKQPTNQQTNKPIDQSINHWLPIDLLDFVGFSYPLEATAPRSNLYSRHLEILVKICKMATGTFKFQADLALCLRCCLKVLRRFQMLLSQGHAVPHHCNSSRDCTALPAGGAEMEADRQIWQQKHIWLTSDTEWFIPFWFQFINVYQLFRCVSDLLSDQFQLSPIWGAAKTFHLSQVTSISLNHQSKVFMWRSQVTLGHMALADGYRDVVLTKRYISTHPGGHWTMEVAEKMNFDGVCTGYRMMYDDVCNYNVWCWYDVYVYIMCTK